MSKLIPIISVDAKTIYDYIDKIIIEETMIIIERIDLIIIITIILIINLMALKIPL